MGELRRLDDYRADRGDESCCDLCGVPASRWAEERCTGVGGMHLHTTVSGMALAEGRSTSASSTSFSFTTVRTFWP